MSNDKSVVKKIDEIRNEISKLPEELKTELKEQGFDINNDQHVYDFYIETLKEVKNLQGENTNNILSEAELDSISGGGIAKGLYFVATQSPRRKMNTKETLKFLARVGAL
ncbi:hypothetical protein [Francisella hispaniensis]|uniref:Uncharacterized protein n=1 Tax=Francisella hispaniensis FSC454 TaxID=1088883 RepID=A0AAC9NNV7_9GAMM|nr:hypothetical protein [Francisella hispaniensis]APD51235.1 hypothetical protein FSC454_09220 [Francisella hispaniensis FSC454]KYW88170.1 hypothetical protein AUF42_08950 [Francisella hispaniensis FSC454]